MSSEDICVISTLINHSPNDANENMFGKEVVNGAVNDSEDREGVQTNFDPDFIEERFRVDRRKLEELIRADENGLCAEEYFSKIMEESDVYIAWPSKLKIGAKSKKDPYVKVSGKKERVADAKNRILSNLTTKSLRVTLKMNVPHTEHSHVIGKGGNNIKKVMMETACHIHFPDSNRNNNNLAEKSSQVSVAGLFPSVEVARSKIRDLLPLVIAFDVLCSGQFNVELLSLVESVQHKYGVSVSVKPHTIQSYLMSIHVRTSVFNSQSAMKAANAVFEHLSGRTGVAYGVSLMMDLSTQHQSILVSSGIHLNRIMQTTGTTIYIPDHFLPNHVTLMPSGSFQILGKKKNVVYINGSMPNVFVARQYLLDCLPIVLMFDCDEEIIIDPGEITNLSEELEVQVVVKLKPKHPSKSVIIKSVERNVDKLYEARRRILNLDDELDNCRPSKSFSSLGYLQKYPYKLGVEGVVVLPSNPTRMPDVSLASYPHNSIISPVMMLPSSQTQVHPCSPCQATHPFYYAPSPPPQLIQRHKIGGRISVSPPSFCSYVTTTTNNTNNGSEVLSYFSTDVRKTSSSSSPQLSPLKTASVSVKDYLFHKVNGLHGDIHQDHHNHHHHQHHHHQHVSLSAGQNNSKDDNNINGIDDVIPKRFIPCDGIFGPDLLQSSGHFQSSSSPTRNNSIILESDFLKKPRSNTDQPEEFRHLKSVGFKNFNQYGPLTANGDHHQHLISETTFSNGGDLNSSSSSSTSSSSQESSLNNSNSSVGSNKAPGSNRPKKNNNNNEPIHPDIQADVDYIKLKNLANQAIQKKPDGECRIPTDYWSGLGFSRSMPQSAIAEKLNHFNQLRYEGSVVPTQYEVANEDSDDHWSPGFNRLQLDDLNKSKTIISMVNQQLSGLTMAQSDLFGSDDCLMRTASPQWLNQESLCDLDPLFNDIGLSKYVNIFKQQEIDMATFLTLTDEDLKGLGINTFGARRKMLLAIEDLNRKQSVLTPPPGIPHPFRDPNFLKRRDIISHSIRW